MPRINGPGGVMLCYVCYVCDVCDVYYTCLFVMVVVGGGGIVMCFYEDLYIVYMRISTRMYICVYIYKTISIAYSNVPEFSSSTPV